MPSHYARRSRSAERAGAAVRHLCQDACVFLRVCVCVCVFSFIIRFIRSGVIAYETRLCVLE